MRRLALVLAIVAVAAGCGGLSTGDVAAKANAVSCDDSGYTVTNRLDNSSATVYDCTFQGGELRCVTVENGLAHDSTAEVRVAFATTLGADRPSCLG